MNANTFTATEIALNQNLNENGPHREMRAVRAVKRRGVPRLRAS